MSGELTVGLTLTFDGKEAVQGVQAVKTEVDQLGQVTAETAKAVDRFAETEEQATARIKAMVQASLAQQASMREVSAATQEFSVAVSQQATDFAALQNRLNAAGVAWRQQAAAERVAAEASAFNSSAVQNLIAKYDPLGAKVRAVQADMSALAKTMGDSARPEIIDTFSRMQSALEKADEAAKKAASELDEVGRSGERGGQKLNAGMTRELIVLGHEAVSGNLSRMPGSFMVLAERMDLTTALMSPMTMGMIAIGVAAAGAALEIAKGAVELDSFNKTLQLTGGYSGLTRDSLDNMAESLRTNVSGGVGPVRDLLEQLSATGQFTANELSSVGAAAVDFKRLSGESSEQVAQMFEGMTKNVVKWAETTNEKYHYLTVTQYEHIAALVKQGEKEQAIIEVSKALHKSMDTSMEKVGLLKASYLGWGQIIDTIKEKLMNLGKGMSSADKVQESIAKENKLRSQLAAERNMPFGGYSAQLEADLKAQHATTMALIKSANDEEFATNAKAISAKVQQEGVAAAAELDALKATLRSKEQIRADEADKIRRLAAKQNAASISAGDGVVYDDQAINSLIEQSNAKYHDAVKRGVDDRRALMDEQIAQEQASLGQEKTIYDQREKMLTLYHSKFALSDEDYYTGRKAARDQYAAAEQAAYEAEVKILSAFDAANGKESAQAQKRLIDLQAKHQAFQMMIADTTNADSIAQDAATEKYYRDVQNAISKISDLELSSLEKAIKAQRLHNDEIGKTVAQKELERAAAEEAAVAELQAGKDAVDSVAALMDQSSKIHDLYVTLSKDLQKQIDLRKQLIAAERDGSAIQAAADLEKRRADELKQTWTSIDRVAEQTWVNIFQGGQSAFQKLAATLKTTVLDLLYQMTLKQWVFNVTASVASAAGVSQQAIAAAGGGSGTGGLIQTGTTLYQGYQGLTSGTGVLGQVGDWLGLGTGASLGTGITASAGTGLALGTGATGTGAALGTGLTTSAGTGLALGTGATGTGAALGTGLTTSAGTGAALGTGAAGTGILSAVATALPWIAAVYAIYTMFADAGGGPKSGGSFLLKDGQVDPTRIYTPGDQDSAMQSIVQSVQSTYQSVAKKLGVQYQKDVTMGIGFDRDPQGTAPSRVTSIVGGVQTTQSYGRDDAALQAGIDKQAAEMIKTALQSSFDSVDAEMGQYFHDHVATTVAEMGDFASGLAAAREMIVDTTKATQLFGESLDWKKLEAAANEGENIVQTYQRVTQEATVFDAGMRALGLQLDVSGVEAMKLKDSMIEAAGGIDAFAAAVQNIVSLKDALYQFDLKMSQTIYSLNGQGDPAAQIYQHGMGLLDQYNQTSDPAQQLALINQMTSDVGAWLQQTQTQIQHQLQQQVAAINSQISALNSEKSAIQSAASARQDALQKELAITQQWSSVLDNAKQMIESMKLTGANPAPASGRLALAQSAVDALQSQYESASGADKAGVASKLLSALQNQLSLAQEVYQRPSAEYQDQYNKIIMELSKVQGDAQSQADRGLELQQQLNSLTEETNAQLSAIDQQIQAAQDAITSAQSAAQAQTDAANAQAAEYYQWLKDQGDKIYQDQLSKATDQLTLLARQVGLLEHIDTVVSAGAGVDTASLPGHADGLAWVPFNDYAMRAHEGEGVIDARTMAGLRKYGIPVNAQSGSGDGGVQIGPIQVYGDTDPSQIVGPLTKGISDALRPFLDRINVPADLVAKEIVKALPMIKKRLPTA